MSIFLLLFAGLILRLINLNQSLWLDEAVQALTSQGSFSYLFSELQGDFHPPFYHLFSWAWAQLFGTSEISLRLPSVLFGVATIWLVYQIGRLISNHRLGLIAAAFFTLAPFHVYYSQEARLYSIATFFTALSMYFLLKLLQAPKKKSLLTFYLLSTTLLLYTDYYGFFILFTQAAIIFLNKKYSLFRFQLLPLFLFLPWLPLLFAQLQSGCQAMITLPEWGKLVNLNFLKALPLTFIKFSIGRITIFNKKLYALTAGGLFLLFGSIMAKGLLKKKNLPLVLWLILPLSFAWLISFFIPNYQPFRLLLVLPAFYLLLAAGIDRISSFSLRSLALALILIINFLSLGVYYFNPYFHREDWRGAVNYLESQSPALVLVPSQTSDWPWQYYSTGKVPLFSVSPGVRPIKPEDLELLKPDQEKVFFIRYLVPLFDPQEEINLWLNNQRFVKIKEISFNQIPVWEYQKQ